jgi:hypothetical protein
MNDLVKLARKNADRGGYYSDDWIKMADHIEKLEAALIRIWAWHPISVSQPRKTLDEIRDFAFATIKGDEE